jgi:phosphatidylinositol-3,4,5-trisphosphate 3-phosphatase/dual-specificity protein phosphatase PTEN
MDFLRQLVSQEKSRFIDETYNLDLTYITPRIIAMAYPAGGFESLFRNKITDVSSFFNIRHKDHYLIMNCSNRLYDYSYFDNRVKDIKWPNHYPCPFYNFLNSILIAFEFLMESKENVISVHCLAGKGRTGSFINCVLFISGKFKSILDANNYYHCKRAVKVDYSSQIRYLLYFESFYKNGPKVLNFDCLFIKKVIVQTKIKEFFEKEYCLELIDFENDKKLKHIDIKCEDIYKINEDGSFIFEKEVKEWESMDSTEFLCNMKEKGMIKNSKRFRMNFSSFFLKDSFSFGLDDVDSLNGNLPPDLKITFIFEKHQNQNIAEIWKINFEETYNKYLKLREKLEGLNSQKKNYFYF